MSEACVKFDRKKVNFWLMRNKDITSNNDNNCV